jgi:hypothetical protein
MVHSVTLGSAQYGHLRFELGRPYVDDPEPYRGVPTKVVFKLGGFEGAFAATLYTTELKSLLGDLRNLYDTLSGPVSFDTLEGQVRFTATVDPTGHVNIAGQLMDVAGTGNELKYFLSLDQSFLPPAIAALEDYAESLA